MSSGCSGNSADHCKGVRRLRSSSGALEAFRRPPRSAQILVPALTDALAAALASAGGGGDVASTLAVAGGSSEAAPPLIAARARSLAPRSARPRQGLVSRPRAPRRGGRPLASWVQRHHHPLPATQAPARPRALPAGPSARLQCHSHSPRLNHPPPQSVCSVAPFPCTSFARHSGTWRRMAVMYMELYT